MTANDIKLLANLNTSENARYVTLNDLEQLADECAEYDIETEITDRLVEVFNDDNLNKYFQEEAQGESK